MKSFSRTRRFMCAVLTISLSNGIFAVTLNSQSKSSLETAVYAALIDSLVRRGADTVLVSDSTLVYRGGIPWRTQSDALLRSLSARLLQRSKTVRPTTTLALPQPFRIFTMSERREIFEKFSGSFRDAWEMFYARYPNQREWVDFSPVAFSDHSNSALVYYQYHCGGLCGGGRSVWLSIRPDGRWQVVKVIDFWVS